MNWLDRYIDNVRAGTPGAKTLAAGPFSRVGSAFNVIACAIITLGGLSLWLSGTPFGLLMVAGGVALETVFVRVLIRARRGDFDDPRL